MKEVENWRGEESRTEAEDVGSDVRLPVASSALLAFSVSSSVAAVVALVGLGDAIYLTVKHLSGEKVPCSIVAGCELVLSSEYASLAGVPLAALGAAAYFVAFSLAVLSFFGNRKMWFLFGVQIVLMSIFTLWLLYLQAFVIEAFCQFCLLSALVTFTLLAIALISKFWHFRRDA